jgi:molybdopterin-guanine dinucleotide biosynthesis protein A
VSNRILIVTSQEHPDFPVTCGAEVMIDFYPGKGPLGGIFTGLLAAESSHILVVACDMLFLNVELLQYMTRLSQHFDAVVPRLERGKLEPLHAIYSKNCLDSMKILLKSNQLKVTHFLDTVRVRYIKQAEARRFDPQLLSFFNVNSQSDLDKAVVLAEDNRY